MIKETSSKYISEIVDEKDWQNGFYFLDETWNYVGPYITEDIAYSEHYRYCKEVL